MVRVLAIAYFCSASLCAGGVWLALPARWWPVDVVGSLLGLALFTAAAGLWRQTAWGWRVAQLVSWGSLAVGPALATLLVWTAAYLAGLYGPVGGGGALLLIAVAALVLPYLVGVPALGLLWLGRAARPGRDAGA